MQLLHKEILIKEHIYNMVKQAFVDNRKLYCQKHNATSNEEFKIEFINISETTLYFVCSNKNTISLKCNDKLNIHFSIRYEGKLFPCEISVRILKIRNFDQKIFFSTTFPLSIKHLQRRLFARYPIKLDYFTSIQLAFTNTDYFLPDKWIFFPKEIIQWGNISIGGMMCYLKEHESWEKSFSYQSKIILNCIFAETEKKYKIQKIKTLFMLWAMC